MHFGKDCGIILLYEKTIKLSEEKMNIKEFIVNTLKGTAIGIANAVPGVSGGTLAVVLKLYDRLMDAIDLNIKKIKENFGFLVSVVLGMGIGIILTAKVLTVLFERYNQPTQFFFIGIVLGSLPMIYKESVKESKLKGVNVIPFICGAAAMVGFTLLTSGTPIAGGSDTLTVGYAIYLAVVGFAAMVAMILPGLSGSMVLKVFGAYDTIIASIDTITSSGISMSERITACLPLIPAGIGIVVGVFAAAKIISILLKKFRQGTYCVIAGLMVGSVYAIYSYAFAEGESFALNGSGIASIITLIIGAALPFLTELPGLLSQKSEE